MISSTTGGASVPVTSGNLLFHVIIDDFDRTFSMDGPGGPNGIRLHYEMMRTSREQKKKLRDFDLRTESQEAALAEMRAYFPDYTFLGSWTSASKMKLAQSQFQNRHLYPFHSLLNVFGGGRGTSE